MSTGSKPRKFAARTVAGTLLAIAGSAAVVLPAHAGGLSDAPSWQDGSVGATLGCTIARSTIDPHICAGEFGFGM